MVCISLLDNKTQTTKDLNKPWKKLIGHGHDARSTVLIDDSALKARLQPYNHLCLSEYDAAARSRDSRALSQRDTKRAEWEKFDNMLLAVIGILDEIQHQDNVSSWIKNGGLWPINAAPAEPRPELPPSASPSASPPQVEPSLEEERPPADVTSPIGNDADADGTVSADVELSANLMWFQDETTYTSWIDRGLKALQSLGILARHGLSR
jgi:hypothetical protein